MNNSDLDTRVVFLNKHKFTDAYCVEHKIGNYDMQFDLMSDLPADVVDQWLDYREKNNSNMPLVDWVSKFNNRYCPSGVKNEGMEDFATELKNMLNDMQFSLNKLFSEYNTGEVVDMDDDDDDEED